MDYGCASAGRETGGNVAERRLAAVRQYRLTGLCQMGLAAVDAILAIVLLVLTLTSGYENLITGASIAIGAAFLTIIVGFLGYLTKSNYSPTDTAIVVGPKMRGLILGHYILCLCTPSAFINALVWLGIGLTNESTASEFAMAIITLILTIIIALANIYAATLFCRHRRAFGMVRYAPEALQEHVRNLERRLEEQERQLRQQQQQQQQQQQPGMHAPPSYDEAISPGQGENFKTQYSSPAYGAPM